MSARLAGFLLLARKLLCAFFGVGRLVHLCNAGGFHSFLPIGGDVVPLPCKLSEVIIVEYEAVSLASGEEGILKAEVAHCFHWIRLSSIQIHEVSVHISDGKPMVLKRVLYTASSSYTMGYMRQKGGSMGRAGLLYLCSWLPGGNKSMHEKVEEEEIEWWPFIHPLTDGSDMAPYTIAQRLLAVWCWTVKTSRPLICPPALTILNIGQFLNEDIEGHAWDIQD